MLQIILQMKVVPLQRTATRGRGYDGLTRGHAIGALVLLTMVTTRRRMEGPVVVLNHVRHLVPVPILLLVIIIQISLDIATVPVKP